MKNPRFRVSRAWSIVLGVAVAGLAGAVAAVLPVSSRAAGGPPVGLIAYTRSGDPSWYAGSHIGPAWVATLGGGDRRRVTGLNVVTEIVWAPDGRTLALAGYHQGAHTASDQEIFVARADGSGLRSLTRNAADDQSPRWSPDGRRIAFVSYRDGEFDSEIYVMNADGSGQTNLTHSPTSHDGSKFGRETGLSWSPDGRQIAFASSPLRVRGLPDIDVIDADGSNRRNLTRSAQSAESLPVWSPDGRTLAFVSPNQASEKVWLMNADGSGQRKLTRAIGQGAEGIFDLAWAGNGNTLVYWAEGLASNKQQCICVVRRDGGGQRSVARGTHPDVSVDGRTVVFERDGVIRAINIDGTNERKLTHYARGTTSNPALQPRRSR